MAAANTKAVARLATGNTLRIDTVTDLMALAELLYKGGASAMPNVDRPEKVARIILAGMEVGLSPAQSLDSIWLGKNGKTSIWGDGALSLILASGLLEKHREWVDGEGEARTGHCLVKRAGCDEAVFTFSVAEANKAGLIERARGQKGDGPWVTYQDRQLKMRARGFALRDTFADVLRGLITTEEMLDYADAQVTVVSATANPPAAPQLPPAPPESAAPAAPGVTPEQLARLSEFRTLLLAGKGIHDADEARAAWAEVLAPLGVSSARQLTSAQAAELIEQLGKQHDPFGHPNSGASKT